MPYFSLPNKSQYILDENCNDPFVKWCIANKTQAVEAFHFNKNAVMKLWKEGLWVETTQ